MPTFGLKEEDLVGDVFSNTNDNYFRRFMTNSMRFLGRKKFMRDHDVAVNIDEEISSRLQNARVQAVESFEEKKRKYHEKFQPAQKTIDSLPVECSEQYLLSVSQAWLEEFRNPSSTANISVHEAIEVASSPAVEKKMNVSVGKNALDATELNNSVPSHLFDHTGNENTSFVNNSLFSQTTSSPVPISSAQTKMFNLESYNGARPSFAGNIFTSTPQLKKGLKFGGNSIVNSPLLEESSVAQSNPAQPAQVQSVLAQPVPTQSSKPAQLEAKVTSNAFGGFSFNTINANQYQPAKESPLAKEVAKSPAPAVSVSVEHIDVTPSIQNAGLHNEFSPLKKYSVCLEKKEDNDLASSRFEKANAAMRVTIKRKVNDTISLVAKRTAGESELRKTATFFRNLIKGNKAETSNAEVLQLDNSDAMAYAIKVIVDYCLNVVTIDGSVINAVAQLLRKIGEDFVEFEQILIGRILCSSKLLSLDMEKCESFVEALKGYDSERKTGAIAEEKSIIKLFFTTFSIDSNEACPTLFSMKNLWEYVAFILNTPHRLLGTIIVLNLVLEVCCNALNDSYPKQWKKIVDVVREDMLDKLEDGILSCETRRTAGEAVHISVLRNTLDNIII